MFKWSTNHKILFRIHATLAFINAVLVTIALTRDDFTNVGFSGFFLVLAGTFALYHRHKLKEE